MNLTTKASCLTLALCFATSAIHAVQTPRLESFFQKSNLFNELNEWKCLTYEQKENFVGKLKTLKLALTITIDDLEKHDISSIMQNFDSLQDEPETEEEMQKRRDEAKKNQPYCF